MTWMSKLLFVFNFWQRGCKESVIFVFCGEFVRVAFGPNQLYLMLWSQVFEKCLTTCSLVMGCYI